jgi:hypothetical protein
MTTKRLRSLPPATFLLGVIMLAGGAVLLLPARFSSAQHNDRVRAQPVAQTIRIPESIRQEHSTIQDGLLEVMMQDTRVGQAARELAALLDPHFRREERIALPPLGLLAPLMTGFVPPDAYNVLPLTDSLRTGLPRMLQEHEAITLALTRLELFARIDEDHAVLELVRRLRRHVRMEEEVLYPAALLVGEVVRTRRAGATSVAQ